MGLRDRPSVMLSRTSATKPAADSHMTRALPTRAKPNGITRLEEFSPVATATVTDAGVEPLSATELEEREHVDDAGTPLQLSDTV